MWTAIIESRTFSKGALQIGVIYSNGTENFTEIHTINSIEDIDSQISSKLKRLDSLEEIQVSLGEYQVKTHNLPNDPKQDAVDNLRRLQDFVELGVLKETDIEVTDAIQLVKSFL